MSPRRGRITLKERLKLLRDHVIVDLPKTKERVTSGGVFIPDNAEKHHTTGTVLAVGPDARKVQIGDKVIFMEWAGVPLPLNDEETYVLLRESDVVGCCVL